MPTVPFTLSGSVTLNGSGAGTVQLGPDGPHVVLLPDTVSVRVQTAGAPNPPEATCALYAGQKPSAATFVDQTFTGSSGDSSGRFKGRQISATQDRYIFAVWAGGEPGGYATVTVAGMRRVP